MSSDLPVIRASDLGKCYRIYNDPKDRFLYPLKSCLRGIFRKTGVEPFRDFWALRHIDLSIFAGETVGIIGRNGSGKSTLLQMLCGTLTNTEGDIEVNGRIAALLELGAGFNPEFTGRENVYMNATVLGLSRNEIDNKYEEIVRFADIGHFIEQPVKHYSSGMYARLAFSVAISVDPQILIVDEALAVGDEAFQRKCYARIEDIKSAGGTILLVSHSASTITTLCDRAVLLHQGRHVYTGSAKIATALYKKLMHADTPELDLIKEDLALLMNAENTGDDEDSILHNMTVLQHRAESGPTEQLFGHGYEADMKSLSTVVYKSKGATIKDVCITTPDGHMVNRLVSGERYLVRYSVRFDSAVMARFRCMIKTIAGVELGGGTFPKVGEPGITVSTGDELSVSLAFQANLAEGTYFVSCGVSDGIASMHRIIDAVMFRVVHTHNTYSIGTIDFFFESSCQVNDAK
jgi:lipopolysaccharide transport system ATP-binding protein